MTDTKGGTEPTRFAAGGTEAVEDMKQKAPKPEVGGKKQGPPNNAQGGTELDNDEINPHPPGVEKPSDR